MKVASLTDELGRGRAACGTCIRPSFVAGVFVLCVLCALCGEILGATKAGDVDKVVQGRFEEYSAKREKTVAAADKAYVAEMTTLGYKLLKLKPARVDWVEKIVAKIKPIDTEAGTKLNLALADVEVDGWFDPKKVKGPDPIVGEWKAKFTNRGHGIDTALQFRTDGKIIGTSGKWAFGRWKRLKPGLYIIERTFNSRFVAKVRLREDRFIGRQTKARYPADEAKVFSGKKN